MALSYVDEKRSLSHILDLAFWRFFGQILFRLVPLPFFELRSNLLRLFGASIGPNTRIYPSARIWHPRNLTIGSCTGIGEGVYLYNKASILIGDYCVISRSVFVCTASHDYNSPGFELFSSPIVIGNLSWIAACSIVMPGLHIQEGSVIGAGSILTKSTDPWGVYAGNPAKLRKLRAHFSEDLKGKA